MIDVVIVSQDLAVVERHMAELVIDESVISNFLEGFDKHGIIGKNRLLLPVPAVLLPGCIRTRSDCYFSYLQL